MALARIGVAGRESAHDGVDAAGLVGGRRGEGDARGRIVGARDVHGKRGRARGWAGITVGGGDGECLAGAAAGQGIDGCGVGHVDVLADVGAGAGHVERAVGVGFGNVVDDAADAGAATRGTTLDAVAGDAVAVRRAERARGVGKSVGGGRIGQCDAAGGGDNRRLLQAGAEQHAGLDVRACGLTGHRIFPCCGKPSVVQRCNDGVVLVAVTELIDLELCRINGYSIGREPASADTGAAPVRICRIPADNKAAVRQSRHPRRTHRPCGSVHVQQGRRGRARIVENLGIDAGRVATGPCQHKAAAAQCRQAGHGTRIANDSRRVDRCATYCQSDSSVVDPIHAGNDLGAVRQEGRRRGITQVGQRLA